MPPFICLKRPRNTPSFDTKLPMVSKRGDVDDLSPPSPSLLPPLPSVTDDDVGNLLMLPVSPVFPPFPPLLKSLRLALPLSELLLLSSIRGWPLPLLALLPLSSSKRMDGIVGALVLESPLPPLICSCSLSRSSRSLSSSWQSFKRTCVHACVV